GRPRRRPVWVTAVGPGGDDGGRGAPGRPPLAPRVATPAGWIGKSKALLRRGRECASASYQPPRRAGGSGGSLRGGPWAGIAHQRRSAPTAPARTWPTRPRVSSWP